MTALVQTLQHHARLGFRFQHPFVVRATAVGVLALTAAAIPNGVDIAGHAITDAYLQVSVFVAATLLVLYALEGVFHADLGRALAQHRSWQVPAGALLGALPGCGGAIVAVTQFTRGTLSFGGVVATLTSTMGDAMFLLLAREPITAGAVLGISMLAGVATGYAVDALHGTRFLQPEVPSAATIPRATAFAGSLTMNETLWLALFVPGLVLGILGAFQVDLGGPLVVSLGVVGATLAIGMWTNRAGENRDCAGGTCEPVPQIRRVIDDTNFVTAWVVFAFVGYELIVAASGIDLGQLFRVWAAAVPAMAIVVGFVPGCGPQIVTTSLYLDGAIPLSAQLGNAISNDGDALFPAIAKAPQAAVLATLYSALPAFVVAYSAYGFGW